jgi:DNA-binding NtrC family response regulator
MTNSRPVKMNKPYIICVDDEKSILVSLRAQLQHHLGDKFYVEVAQSASEAREVIQSLFDDGEQVAVIISDYIMPITKGDELLITLHEQYPEMTKIMLTGHADDSAILHTYDKANLAGCFGKPWEIEDILTCIKQHMPGN